MKHAVAAARLPQALALIEHRLGLHFAPSRHRELATLLTEAVAEDTSGEAAAWLNRPEPGTISDDLLQSLARKLTVGETYFFREPATLDILESKILPELIRKRRKGGRRLRLWSAGCCTGEEPYTLAMILEGLLPDIDDWDIRILATDLNREFLKRAAQGDYRDWSFRQIRPGIRERFFRETRPGIHALHPRIRERVTFAPLNLATDDYPSPLHDTGDMDVILCRNVLMYFSERQARAAMTRLHRSLAPSGWLALSPTEHALRRSPGFRSVHVNGAFLYQKINDTDSARAAPRVHAPVSSFPVALPIAPPPSRRPPDPSPRRSAPAPVAAPSPPTRAALPHNLDLAQVHFRQGRYDEADFEIKQVLRTTPGHPVALVLRARLAANRGRLSEALQACDEALVADKMNPALYCLRARILEELGRPEEAGAALRRVLYLEPESIPAHFAMGNLAMHQHQNARARRSFAHVLTLLQAVPPDTELPDMDGLTAGHLIAMTRSLTHTAA